MIGVVVVAAVVAVVVAVADYHFHSTDITAMTTDVATDATTEVLPPWLHCYHYY